MDTKGVAAPSFFRAIRLIAVLLAAGCIAFSLVFSQLAPLGVWPNLIFGTPKALEFDPGGFYLDAAHQLVWGGTPLFEGHPGTPLLLLLSGVQHVYYFLAGGSSGLSFTEFIARNLPTVFVLSKGMMTLLHLAAAFVTYHLARRILWDERPAVFAALGYLTSLPVAHYLSRISVEPLMVLCFELSLLAIWSYEKRAAEGRPRSALGFAGLSAMAAVSGVVTKLSFLVPLPPFLLAIVLLGGWGNPRVPSIPWRLRAAASLVFLSSAAMVLFVYSQLIDWDGFFQLWSRFTGREGGLPWSLANLLPGTSSDRAFVLCEFAYLGLAFAGFVAFVRRVPERRMQVLQVSVWFAWGVVLYAYRVSLAGTLRPFHYFHLSNAIAALFFGYAILLALQRLAVPDRGWQAAVLGVLAILGIHAGSLWAVVGSRLQDAAFYAPNREIHRVIAGLGPERRLGCIECDPRTLETRRGYFGLHSVGWTTGKNGERSLLAAEFESLFVPVGEDQIAADAVRLHVEALGATVVVVDSTAMPSRRRRSRGRARSGLE
jgi:hypothetical protein